MTRPAVRVALLIVFLAAMGATADLFWVAERQSQLTETTSRFFDASAHAADRVVSDLRSAQQAYVAAGQGIDFWIARTTTLVEDIKSRLGSLKSEATAPASASAFDDALAALQDFEQMDLHARDYARGRQVVLASDLIFAEGLDLTRKVSGAIERGRTAELAARDSERAALQRREVFSLGAAGTAATLIVLLLMPSRRPAMVMAPTALATAGTVVPIPMPAEDISLALESLDAFDEDEGWTSARNIPAESVPVNPAEEEPANVVPPPAPAAPFVDLQAVATVCNDLARVVDTRALPGLLERTAGVLDASGIILWIADPDGRELMPIVTHGYASNLVNRLGTITRDAENVTAAAYRTSLLQTVKADSVSNGAIAVPLVTPTGCVGVMAAEVRHQAEEQDTVRAAASIVAAQLAALVGPPSSRSKAEAS
jgi:GAF domain-containing protein